MKLTDSYYQLSHSGWLLDWKASTVSFTVSPGAAYMQFLGLLSVPLFSCFLFYKFEGLLTKCQNYIRARLELLQLFRVNASARPCKRFDQGQNNQIYQFIFTLSL